MARALTRDLEKRGLKREGNQGTLDIRTTGSVEEYTLRARQVGLERVESVEFYPPMEL